MMYTLLIAGIACCAASLKFIGPPAWALGVLGVVLLISSYLWELYHKA